MMGRQASLFSAYTLVCQCGAPRLLSRGFLRRPANDEACIIPYPQSSGLSYSCAEAPAFLSARRFIGFYASHLQGLHGALHGGAD